MDVIEAIRREVSINLGLPFGEAERVIAIDEAGQQVGLALVFRARDYDEARSVARRLARASCPPGSRGAEGTFARCESNPSHVSHIPCTTPEEAAAALLRSGFRRHDMPILTRVGLTTQWVLAGPMLSIN